MTENKRVYNFDDYITSSSELAELFFYSKKIEAFTSFSEAATVGSLVENQSAVFGAAVRMTVSLKEFLKKEYQTELDDVVKGSYASQIAGALDKMKGIAFYLPEAALALPIENLRSNLQQVSEINQTLPKMIAALDFGEDEEK